MPEDKGTPVVDDAAATDDATFESFFNEAVAGVAPVDDKTTVTETLIDDSKPVTDDKATIDDKSAVSDVTPVDVKNEDTTDYKALYETELQRTRSWDGRLSAEKRRADELQAKLDELSKPPVTDDKAVSINDDVLKAFADEMGDDFIKPMTAFINKLITDAVAPYKAQLEELGAVKQQVVEISGTVNDGHIQAILEAHEDLPDIIKPDSVTGKSMLDSYVETLPYAEAVKAKEIIDKGTTKQVIKLLTDYKEATKQPAQNNAPIVDDKKVADAVVVKDKAKPILPKGTPNKNDFDSAWAEAVST